MRIDYLSEHPELAPTLAAWHHAEWACLLPGWTLPSALADLQTHIGRRQIPTTFVALAAGQPVGSASLLERDLDGWEPLRPGWRASLLCPNSAAAAWAGNSCAHNRRSPCAERTGPPSLDCGPAEVLRASRLVGAGTNGPSGTRGDDHAGQHACLTATNCCDRVDCWPRGRNSSPAARPIRLRRTAAGGLWYLLAATLATEGEKMPIAIAGMHRSGTSMIARLLRDCGLDLGPDHLLLPAAPDNPEGFWELEPLVAVSCDILEHFRSGWNSPPDLSPNWETAADMASLLERARRVPAEVGLTEPWGWKDPRTALMLPFWQQVWPDLRVVICVRNPLAVAQSLLERDQFSYLTGLELWLTYNRRLLDSVSPECRIVTHYEAYFHDGEAELTRVVGRLGLPADGARVRSACATVQAGLRHWQLVAADLEPRWRLCRSGRVLPGTLRRSERLRSRSGRGSAAAGAVPQRGSAVPATGSGIPPRA